MLPRSVRRLRWEGEWMKTFLNETTIKKLRELDLKGFELEYFITKLTSEIFVRIMNELDKKVSDEWLYW